MAYLRYLIFLFASSMVVKIPLMTLFHGLYLLITGDPWIESSDHALATLQRSEIIFFIPLYLIYLPLFIYNIKTHRMEPRFMYWDMSMICLVVCPLAFGIAFQYGLWFALGTAVFVAAYLILTAAVHLRLCWPYIFDDGQQLPRHMDKTLPEYTAWQEKVETLKKEREEKYASIYAENQQKTAEQKKRNKIGYIFFFTDFSAYLIIGLILYYALMAIILLYSCHADHILTECTHEFLSNAFQYIGKEEAFLIVFICTLTIYAPSYLLYVPIVRKLWQLKLRNFAHFGLAACPAILVFFINTIILVRKSTTPEEESIAIFSISALLILKSITHLIFLKLYDKYIGIPEEPPRSKRWYDRFFRRQAKATAC